MTTTITSRARTLSGPWGNSTLDGPESPVILALVSSRCSAIGTAMIAGGVILLASPTALVPS